MLIERVAGGRWTLILLTLSAALGFTICAPPASADPNWESDRPGRVGRECRSGRRQLRGLYFGVEHVDVGRLLGGWWLVHDDHGHGAAGLLVQARLFREGYSGVGVGV